MLDVFKWLHVPREGLYAKCIYVVTGSYIKLPPTHGKPRLPTRDLNLTPKARRIPSRLMLKSGLLVFRGVYLESLHKFPLD